MDDLEREDLSEEPQDEENLDEREPWRLAGPPLAPNLLRRRPPRPRPKRAAAGLPTLTGGASPAKVRLNRLRLPRRVGR
jgi:hypothetical protein